MSQGSIEWAKMFAVKHVYAQGPQIKDPTQWRPLLSTVCHDDDCPIRGQLMKVRPVSKAGGIILQGPKLRPTGHQCD